MQEKKVKYPLFIKLITLALVLELITGIVILFSGYSFSELSNQDKARSAQVISLQNYVLRHDLKSRKDSDYSKNFEFSVETINKNIELINKTIGNIDSNDSVTDFIGLNKEYRDVFDKYVKLLRLRGLDENSGIEGEFRKRVHEIEDIINLTGDKSRVYVDMLQSRRREKDFIMRGKLDYVIDVENHIKDLKRNVAELDMQETRKEKISYLADEYLSSFRKLVQISSQIEKIEVELSNIELRIQDKIESIVADKTNIATQLQNMQIPVFIFSVLLGLVLAIFISRSITKPVENLQQATVRIAEGDLKIKVSVNSNDEIGDLAKFFNVMTANIRRSNETILNQRSELEVQNVELSSLNATKDKFFSIIAHDLKNPINAFNGISSFLAERYDQMTEEDIKECITDINSSAKHLYELLENLLTWSRAQRGKIEFSPVKIDLNQIALHSLFLLKLNAENKNITLTNSIPQFTDVFIDPNMVNTVIRNLVSNAIKFTPENGNIEVGCVDKNDMVKVFIKDSGIGISQEDQHKLFRIDVHHTTIGTSAEEGTGLGLILCKEFVGRHGGSIWVESKLGEGATFKFTIPKNNTQLLIEENNGERLIES